MESTADSITAHAADTRRLAARLDAQGRSDLLVAVTEAIYNAVKHDHPEGEGLDGRDGPERRSLGSVADAARDHQDNAYQRTK